MHRKNNYYQNGSKHLLHLSAGAIIKREDGKILVHYLKRIGGKYFLPKKTMLPYGAVEQAVHATSLETGWKIQINNYLGSIQSEFPNNDNEIVSKTTLYFLCSPITEVGRDPDDRDADSSLVWMKKDELIKIFKKQRKTDI